MLLVTTKSVPRDGRVGVVWVTEGGEEEEEEEEEEEGTFYIVPKCPSLLSLSFGLLYYWQSRGNGGGIPFCFRSILVLLLLWELN